MPEAGTSKNINYINNNVNNMNNDASICHHSVHRKSWFLPAEPTALSHCYWVCESFTRFPCECMEQEKISSAIRASLMLWQATRSCSSAQKCIKLKISYIVCPRALMERQFQHITLNYLEALKWWATRDKENKRVVLVIEIMIKLASQLMFLFSGTHLYSLHHLNKWYLSDKKNKAFWRAEWK